MIFPGWGMTGASSTSAMSWRTPLAAVAARSRPPSASSAPTSGASSSTAKFPSMRAATVPPPVRTVASLTSALLICGARGMADALPRGRGGARAAGAVLFAPGVQALQDGGVAEPEQVQPVLGLEAVPRPRRDGDQVAGGDLPGVACDVGGAAAVEDLPHRRAGLAALGRARLCGEPVHLCADRGHHVQPGRGV